MLDQLQQLIHSVFAGILNTTSQGAIALFDASVIAATVFYVWSLVTALRNGGGSSLFETAAFRLLILFGLAAMVNGWPVLANAIRNDILAFAAHVSNTSNVSAAAFTPDGIIDTSNKLIAVVYHAGAGHSFLTQLTLSIWKLASIIFLFLGGIGLALALWFANVSLDIVFAGCAVLMGFVISPWLHSYAMQYVGLIVGTAVYIILVGIFVGLAQTLALLTLGFLNSVPQNATPGAVLSGPAMLELSILIQLFALLAWVVPGWVASRIAGGAPIVQVGNVMAAAQKGFATSRG